MQWLGARLHAFSARARTFLWPFYLVLVQNHRAGIQSSGITLTVLAGVYSIAFAFLQTYLEDGLTPERFIKILLLLLVASYILIVVSGGIALRTADPETNARILLAGRPAKEVLFTISKRIDRSCRRSLRYSTWAESILEDLERRTQGDRSDNNSVDGPLGRGELSPDRRRLHNRLDRFARWISLRAYRIGKVLWPDTTNNGETKNQRGDTATEALLPEALRDEIDCLLWWLRQLPRKQYTELLRIEVMKHRASQELDIPPRRLCDHLFQYSPAVHRDRLAKYIQCWEEILDFWLIDRKTDKPRLREKVIQNLSFIANTRRRRGYQGQILENRDLHPFIVQFASMHSTSGSLQTYADALRFVAMVGKKRLSQARGSMEKREEEKVQARLVFLCRKQMAHPGFDLHALIIRALGCMGTDRLAATREILDNLERGRSMPGNSNLTAVSKGQLDSFRGLSFSLASYVAASRETIAKRFAEEYNRWFLGVDSSRYVVSHGYSRTVLSILKHSLLLREGGKHMPRLFFMLPDQKESFDTRVMEYEMREENGLHRFHNLAAGSESHLRGLLQNKGPVLVLLGAECFDDDRRVVHPRGFGNGLSTLLEEMKDRAIPCLVVVVAESYKRNEKPLADDINFYGQHFDRIDLYPPELIDVIITEKEELRKNGK